MRVASREGGDVNVSVGVNSAEETLSKLWWMARAIAMTMIGAIPIYLSISEVTHFDKLNLRPCNAEVGCTFMKNYADKYVPALGGFVNIRNGWPRPMVTIKGGSTDFSFPKIVASELLGVVPWTPVTENDHNETQDSLVRSILISRVSSPSSFEVQMPRDEFEIDATHPWLTVVRTREIAAQNRSMKDGRDGEGQSPQSRDLESIVDSPSHIGNGTSLGRVREVHTVLSVNAKVVTSRDDYEKTMSRSGVVTFRLYRKTPYEPDDVWTMSENIPWIYANWVPPFILGLYAFKNVNHSENPQSNNWLSYEYVSARVDRYLGIDTELYPEKIIPALCKSKDPNQMRDLCETKSMRAQAFNFMENSASYKLFLVGVTGWAGLKALHDVLLIADVSETRTLRIGCLSIVFQGIMVTAVWLCMTGAFSVFFAVVEEDGACGCYYSMPLLPSLLAVATPLILLSMLIFKAQAFMKSLKFGDYLYYQRFDIPFHLGKQSRSFASGTLLTDDLVGSQVSRLATPQQEIEIVSFMSFVVYIVVYLSIYYCSTSVFVLFPKMIQSFVVSARSAPLLGDFLLSCLALSPVAVPIAVCYACAMYKVVETPVISNYFSKRCDKMVYFSGFVGCVAVALPAALLFQGARSNLMTSSCTLPWVETLGKFAGLCVCSPLYISGLAAGVRLEMEWLEKRRARKRAHQYANVGRIEDGTEQGKD